MQLNTNELAGGIRNMILAKKEILPQPLNMMSFEGVINQTHTILNMQMMDHAIHLRNMKPTNGSYQMIHVPNQGYETTINIKSYGYNAALEQQLHQIEQYEMVALVNLYAHYPNEYLIVGDLYQPLRIINYKVVTGNRNQDTVELNLQLHTLSRTPPPTYFGHF